MKLGKYRLSRENRGYTAVHALGETVRAKFSFGAILSIITDFTDEVKQAGEPAWSDVFRMIVRKLFLELHGIIGLNRSIRPIP